MSVLTALFDLNGTATRKQAFRVFLVVLATFGSAALVERFAPTLLRFVIPVAGLLGVWWWATLVRRFHDAGRSGAWAVLLPVPIVGLLVSVAGLFLKPDRPFNDSNAGLRMAGTLGLVFVALLALSRVFWAPYWIPSESMKPSLLVGDYFVTRLGNGANMQRGDVVVFRHPVNGATMVARLVGLPGDQVAMKAGAPVLNGATLAQTEAGLLGETYGPQGPNGVMPRCTNAVVGVGGICEKRLQRETLPDGRSYLVADIETGSFADDTAIFTVPEGQLFLLGDNRDNSTDSRFAQGAGGMGFVPAENVIGRATRVIVSSAGAQLWALWDWRWARIFKAVE